MSPVESHHDGVAHETDVERVNHDPILTHLIDEMSLPHTPEEQEMIRQQIHQRVFDILQPDAKAEQNERTSG